MYVLDVVMLVVLPAVVVALMCVAPRILDTFIWSLSGEQGGTMSSGFMRRSLRTRRTVELQALVSHLALITRLNLPLCSALEAAAMGESRRMARTLREMSRSIGAGIPVSAALAAACRGCPVQLAVILRRAEECGQLPQALAEQERMIAATVDVHLRSTDHARHAVAYATFMVLFAGGMVSWVMVVLLPRFREIFEDYNAALPRMTVILMDVASWFVTYGWGIVIVVLLILLGMVLVCVRACAGGEKGIALRTVAAVRWAMPITRTLDYGLGMGKATRSMALGIRSGSPITFAATLPSVVSVTNHLRRRLDEFAQGVSDGIAPHQAARDAKLGDVFISALKMVEHGEDPERVLGHAADYYEAIAYRWWHALTAVSGPLVTLALAAMVGFIALALFMPLVALINATAETI